MEIEEFFFTALKITGKFALFLQLHEKYREIFVFETLKVFCVDWDMLILACLGTNNFNQKTGQSLALYFFVSCTAGAKTSFLRKLNKFSLLKIETILFDAMI